MQATFPWRAATLSIIALLFLIASRHFIVDDGLIYARFLDNALTGRGLVFNPGESVNALTSPLFTDLLLVASWLLRGNVLLAEHLFFAVTFLATCLAAERIVPWSGVAVASTAYFYVLIGLETSLFLGLILLVALLYQHALYDWLPLALILTALTRFEGALLIPIVAWHLWRQRRFPRALAFLLPAMVLLAYMALNHHWYGSFLPNSATSKFGQARSGYWGRWPTAFLRVDGWALRGHRGVFRRTAYILPLVAWFGLRGWQAMRGTRLHSIFAPFFLGLTAFYVLANIPSYHWYYAPLIFIAILYAVRGIPPTRFAHAAFAVILVVSGITNFFFLRIWGPDWDYVNIAQWINRNTPPTASVETVELGQIGWYTHRRVIDILGLTYPKNARHIAAHDPASWLAEDRPDYIVIHQPLMPYEVVATLHPEYRPVPFHSGPIYLLKREDAPPLPANQPAP